MTIRKLAVTVNFGSGHDIKLLQSIKTETGYRIPRPGEYEWSNVIRPSKFAEKLTNGNVIISDFSLLFSKRVRKSISKK